MKLKNKLLVLTWSLVAALGINTQCFAENIATITESMDNFIEKMVEKNHFDPLTLKTLFSQIHIDPTVTDKMNKPYEAQPWDVYKKFFITDERIALGAQYWQQHAAELAHAEQVYGVPARIIVAIIGVESKFGTKQGDFPTLQSLATLAFNYPSRAPFFTSELENYLLMTREQKLDPLAIKGSYAGAIGKPQFMPSSYRHYAVAFDGGPHANLISNDADAICSVANYFKRNGWKTNERVMVSAKANAAALKSVKQDPLKLNATLAELRQQGISWDEKLAPDTKASFFTVQEGDALQQWLALNNFIVITRYNHNMQYALVVNQFSEAIENKFRAAQQERRDGRD